MKRNSRSKRGNTSKNEPLPAAGPPRDPGDWFSSDADIESNPGLLRELRQVQNRQKRDAKAHRLADRVVARLLSQAQRNNPRSLRLLHHIAKAASEALRSLPITHGALRELAAEEHEWPILMPANVKTSQDPNIAYLKELGVGGGQVIKAPDFRRYRSPLRTLVQAEIELVRSRIEPARVPPLTPLVAPNELARFGISLRKVESSMSEADFDLFSLKPLQPTRISMEQWYKAIEALVLHQTEGNPTSPKFPELRQVGKSHETHGGAKPGSRTAESNIRDLFFARLEETFRTLVLGDRRRKPR